LIDPLAIIKTIATKEISFVIEVIGQFSKFLEEKKQTKRKKRENVLRKYYWSAIER